MYRTALVSMLALVLSLACTPPPTEAQNDAKASEPSSELSPLPPPVEQDKAEIVRKDLVAEGLPVPPTLDTLSPTVGDRGQFGWPAGTNELAVRAAVELGDGLLLVGQAYQDRQAGRPSPSWKWIGMVPRTGASSSNKLGEGAIRAALRSSQGGALLAGTVGQSADPRGWFGIVDGDGALEFETALDSPSATELFDLLPGRSEGELALVFGYVDAQGWVVSLDGGAGERWQKFIGSFGYTQIRAAAALDSELLVVGTRAQRFGESWWARVPGDGGIDPSPSDVLQDKLDIEGADQHQMLRAIVDLGEAGLLAIGTAKRNYIQDHDQLLAVAFERSGAPRWSKVLSDVRVTEIFGGRAGTNAAMFVLGVPAGEGGQALALLELGVDASAVTKQIDQSRAWQSAGFVEGSAQPSILAWGASESGMQWQRFNL